ncbi:thiosulfate:glutathione sulfurtransferase [Aulostomus maculatus]
MDSEVRFLPLRRETADSNLAHCDVKWFQSLFPEVTYSQLKVLLSEHDVQLFDVRTSEEYQAGHIEDAVNIPVNILEESLKMHPDQFEEKFDVRLPGRDDQNIVFYCKSGNRSLTAVNTARQLGFSRARHYKGGYSEWSRLEEK